VPPLPPHPEPGEVQSLAVRCLECGSHESTKARCDWCGSAMVSPWEGPLPFVVDYRVPPV
jgi:ribosomal protein S27E